MSRFSRLILSGILVLAGIPFAVGCYTVIRHPEPDALVSHEDGSRKSCETCHVDSRFYHDAFDPQFFGYGNYWSDSRWGDYYFRPWWYRDFWYYEPGQGGAPGTPVETGGRHMWGAGGRREIGAATPVFPGSSGAGVGGGSVSGSAPAAPPPSAGGTPAAPAPSATRSGDNYRSTSRRELGTPNAPKSGEAPAEPAPPESPKKADDPDGKPPR